ncbi:MAG: alpha/beta fold hydrolase [Candidatus Aminicenantes bacterium]|nr:alpha/beta fold hydrolase [Candidatus Aminicenantes bacterium]
MIDVCGDGIRFVDQGQGEPLILLHGIGASLEWWEPNIPSLSRKYRVIAPDFLGFGLSDKPPVDYNLRLGIRFLSSLMDVLGLSRVSLAGNSMGGLIALAAAIEIPERIERLILVDNAGFQRKVTPYLRLGTLPLLGEGALCLRSRSTVRFFLSRIFYDREKISDRLIDGVLTMFNDRRTRQVFLEVLRYGVGLGGFRRDIQEHITKGAAHLKQKTMIIWGTKDKVIPLEQAVIGEKLIPRSCLFLIERCGHAPQLEWPEKFNRLVLDFMEKP